MKDSLTESYLKDVRERFRSLKTLADKAIEQVGDEEFFRAPDAESNSIAVIIKHTSGNMRSRWTDFLTSDGEKPDRQRDAEFVVADEDRHTLLAAWEDGWSCLYAALDAVAQDGDLLRIVTIRHEPHTVVEAINRQLAHYGYHTGQIVFLAKHLRAGEWKSLSVARGSSDMFNEEMRRKHEEA